LSRNLSQSQAADLVVVLTLSADDTPATGLTYADIVVDFSKHSGAFQNKILAAPDVTELGSGVYSIAFTAGELDTLGEFVIKVTGATVNQFIGVHDVSADATASTTASLPVCVISGHILGLEGDPVQNASVSARILSVPSTVGSVGVSTARVGTFTNANGEFFLTLTRLAYVEIIIPETGYKRTITVPNVASANLFTDI
jgi:hypothetical protein